MNRKLILTAFICLFLTACSKNNFPAADISQIDDKLEDNKNLGNAAVTYDITKQSEEEKERKKDDQNVYIDKKINLKKEGNNLAGESQSQASDANTEMTTVNELLIVDDLIGQGQEAKNGDILSVHYTGKLTNGQIFDSSVGKAPFEFTLGAGQVIKGWDQGLVGMKVGGKRTLTIPADLAYGDRGAGSIPPGATLIFETELLQIK